MQRDQTSNLPICPTAVDNVHTGQLVTQQPVIDEPAPRTPFLDPTFNTCVIRVTDRDKDVFPEDESGGLKNEYSRVQSFNVDDSLLIIRSTEATWYLYDAVSLTPIALLPFGGAVDPRWDPEDPNVLFYNEETRLMRYDLTFGEISVQHDFAADFPDENIVWVSTRHEGSPSRDGRYWGFVAQDENWEAAAFLVYDMETDKVVAIRELGRITEVDSVTISPSGNYFAAFFDYCESELGTDKKPCGFMVYDRSLKNGRGLLRIVGHADIAFDHSGNEVLVYQDIDRDEIAMIDLASGERTAIVPIDFSYTNLGFHFSGQAYEFPGWVLVSTHDGDLESHTWMDDQVFALELKAEGKIIHLANTHSIVNEDQEHDYWAEPHATVNRDFTRALFTTNWGRSGTDQIETYLVNINQDWFRDK